MPAFVSDVSVDDAFENEFVMRTGNGRVVRVLLQSDILRAL
jgi:hypothetical protein